MCRIVVATDCRLYTCIAGPARRHRGNTKKKIKKGKSSEEARERDQAGATLSENVDVDTRRHPLSTCLVFFTFTWDDRERGRHQDFYIYLLAGIFSSTLSITCRQLTIPKMTPCNIRRQSAGSARIRPGVSSLAEFFLSSSVSMYRNVQFPTN